MRDDVRFQAKHSTKRNNYSKTDIVRFFWRVKQLFNPIGRQSSRNIQQNTQTAGGVYPPAPPPPSAEVPRVPAPLVEAIKAGGNAPRSGLEMTFEGIFDPRKVPAKLTRRV